MGRENDPFGLLNENYEGEQQTFNTEQIIIDGKPISAIKIVTDGDGTVKTTYNTVDSKKDTPPVEKNN